MLDFARSDAISTQTNNIFWINYNDMVSLVKCTFHLKLSVLKSTPMSPTAFHIRPTCRDWPAAIDHRSVVSTIAPPVRTDVPRTLPPLRTSYLEHLPSQADERKTLAYDLLQYLSVLIRVTMWVCEILTLFSYFSISIFESIPQLYKQKKLGQRRHSRFCSKGS